MAAAGSGPGDRLLGDADKLTVPERAVYLVFLTVFIDTLAASISTPMMPYYASSFGVSTAAVGWLYGAWSFSSTVFAPILSRTADKLGRRPILVGSLVGAGVANLVQGCAPNFSVFLFGRFFSGIWAAVGSTCSVYVTDVAPESVRPSYLSKLALVPLLAMLFGPGLGGGLAKLGLNVPILVDAWLTLFSAAVVGYYLPETPAFLGAKLARKQSLEDGQGKTDAKEPAKGTTGKVPPVVHVLGLANFLGGFSFSTLLSTFAIFMAAKYNFDPLHVGFSFVGNAVIMMLTNVWGVPFLHGRLSVFQCWALGSVVQGLSYMAFSMTPTVWSTLAFYGVGGVGMSIRNANGSTITASFTQTDNRAKIFSIIQTYSNFGRMVGPIISTHLAQVSLPLPFLLAGFMNILSAGVVAWAEGKKPGAAAPPAAETTPVFSRKPTIFGGEWQDDVGTAEDKRKLGEFMGELLTRKHYRWVSRREEVEALLERVLPDLETSDREAYQAQLASLAKYE